MADYILIRQKRKTISLEVRAGEIFIKAPMSMSEFEINEFISRHTRFIEKRKAFYLTCEKQKVFLSAEELKFLPARARILFEERVHFFAPLLGVAPKSIRITSAKTRFGSCSGDNRLSFSKFTALLSPPLVDYIVVHELAHIKIKNHQSAFYALVASILPDYKVRQKQLKLEAPKYFWK